MESLYVCHFSNGHIKVGRSIDPVARIASHADRVACLGVELIEHHVIECVGRSIVSEASLIQRCAANATQRNKNEWFVGLEFPLVCDWANECAKQEHAFGKEFGRDDGRTDFQAVVRALMAKGTGQIELGRYCGCSQASISDIATGRTVDPSYSIGARLLDLLSEVVA